MFRFMYKEEKNRHLLSVAADIYFPLIQMLLFVDREVNFSPAAYFILVIMQA